MMRSYSTDEKCRELLKRLRWPKGVKCPRCKSDVTCAVADRDQFECKCGYQFSVTAGTIFGDSHLPLETWFAAVLLMVESRKGISANQVKRLLGVSYKTAWYLCHRIRDAMRESGRVSGIIEMDETYVGGKTRGRQHGRDNKQIVGAIRERGGKLRFFHAKDLTAETFGQYLKQFANEDKIELFITDELPMYKLLGWHLGKKHKTIRHKRRQYVRGIVHTNTVESAFSLLKRGIIGTWHQVSAKHLPAYLNEMAFRFNRRERQDLFTDTLRHMVNTPTLTFKELTA